MGNIEYTYYKNTGKFKTRIGNDNRIIVL
jgi:hypothetical protein